MDKHTYAIERAKQKVLEARRAQAARDADTTAVFDYSVAIRDSRTAATRNLAQQMGLNPDDYV